ncbi:MAG: TonB-dependent receptor plug domain-containing protein [Magnetospirillum sp.]|nr:TonB-dependent receptor plug domain-containing protein [Magnetospirillum sp.]
MRPVRPCPRPAVGGAGPVRHRTAAGAGGCRRAGQQRSRPLGRTVLDASELSSKRKASGDTAGLLKDIPGVSLYSGGGASSLPAVRGLADDRLKVEVDGMPITAACPNHMNPPLSYIAPDQVGAIEVLSGITPVSAGGDSIGGTIKVDSPEPKFAAPGQDLLTTGRLSAGYSSNNHAISTGGEVTAATANASAKYSGSWTRAGDYHRGGDGAPVQTSLYQIEDHTVSLAGRRDGHLVELQGGWQFSPYEGFPNQRMDLTENSSKFLNGRYAGQFGWGKLDANAYWRGVEHEMDFLGKVKSANTMPMNTESDEFGYNLKAELPLNPRDTLRVGNEFQRYTLDDWWPPVTQTVGMMGPNNFFNIHDGQRNRIGTFAEWDARWTEKWSSQLGIRNDTVWMNTGEVQGYNGGMMYGPDAAAFNAKDRSQTDVNFDLTALLRYDHDKTASYEAGYARKTRSPNLYERYAWSTNSMASSMNTWFGDGNGYIGDVNLKPEIANTVSVAADWHDAAKKTWGFKVSPYYTYVQDYIDADLVANYTGTLAGYGLYRFANHDAELFGVDISGNRELMDDISLGRAVFKGSLSWVRGRNLDTGDNLYNIMPLNARLGVDHQLGGWSSGVEPAIGGQQGLRLRQPAGKHHAGLCPAEPAHRL